MDELIPATMAGTQRRPPILSDPLVSALEGSAEDRLLGAAALVGLATLAGQRTRPGKALPADPLPDPRKVAPPRHLLRILEGEQRALLPEWLGLARARNFRADPRDLPRLLEIGRSDRSLRTALAEVAGPRGAWLASSNPNWGYLLGQSQADDVWQTGQSAARMDWFALLRQNEPQRARELLQESWSKESADERQRCLQAFRAGLSMQDEEFLEAALEDRSKGVRAQAAQMLARLPASRLCLRAKARVQSWIHVKQTSSWMGMRKSNTLEINLPGECSAEMQRDGIEAKPGRRELGEKAWWLEQCLAQAPLDLWQLSPQELLEIKSDFGEALRQGWTQAAVSQRNLPWAAALLEKGATDEELFALLPHAQQEAWLLKKMSVQSSAGFPLSWLRLHQPYSPGLAVPLLKFLRKLTEGTHDWNWAQMLPELALHFPPNTSLPEDWPADGRWRSAVESFLSTLQFRQSMNQEMQP